MVVPGVAHVCLINIMRAARERHRSSMIVRVPTIPPAQARGLFSIIARGILQVQGIAMVRKRLMVPAAELIRGAAVPIAIVRLAVAVARIVVRRTRRVLGRMLPEIVTARAKVGMDIIVVPGRIIFAADIHVLRRIRYAQVPVMQC